MEKIFEIIFGFFKFSILTVAVLIALILLLCGTFMGILIA